MRTVVLVWLVAMVAVAVLLLILAKPGLVLPRSSIHGWQHDLFGWSVVRRAPPAPTSIPAYPSGIPPVVTSVPAIVPPVPTPVPYHRAPVPPWHPSTPRVELLSYKYSP